MRWQHGVVEFPPSESSLSRAFACVRVRRTRLGGWRVRRAEVADGTTARVLSPFSTLVVEGSPDEIEERKTRLERFGGRKLSISYLHRNRRGALALLAGAAELAELESRGERGVPLQLALASVAAQFCRERSFNVYWGCAEMRFICGVRNGLPAATTAPGSPCVMLTIPDEAGEALITPLAPNLSIVATRAALAELTPLEIVAFGAVLARTRPGSFPVRERRVRFAFPKIGGVTAAAVLAAGAAIFWRVENSTAASIQPRIEEERRAVETLDMELRARAFAASKKGAGK